MQSSISLYSYEGKTNPLLHENSMHHFDDVTLFRFFSLTRKTLTAQFFLPKLINAMFHISCLQKDGKNVTPNLTIRTK